MVTLEFMPTTYPKAVHIRAGFEGRVFYFFMHKETHEATGSSSQTLWDTCKKNQPAPKKVPADLNDAAFEIARRIYRGEKNIFPTPEQKAAAKQRREEIEYFIAMEKKIYELLNGTSKKDSYVPSKKIKHHTSPAVAA